MKHHQPVSRFYVNMGVLLLVLVFAGFGSAMFIKGAKLTELPILYHLHGLTYIVWFSLFILQAYLIGGNYRSLHRKLGYSSLVLVVCMMVTAVMMASHSYTRGISPVPIMTIKQFIALPMIDFLGLLIFFSLAFFNRHRALIHKHCMLLTSIAIMDPAVARLAASLGIPPAAMLIHIALIGLMIIHDRRARGKVHPITWIGLSWIILRVVFIFTVGATQGWADFVDMLFA